MRRPRDIRRAPEMAVQEGGYNGGYGDITMERWTGSVVWVTDETGWQHVSVCPYDPDIMPTWDEMCRIKDIFFEDEEIAIQMHPPKSHYVNIMQNCLHLWRPLDKYMLQALEGGGDNN